VAQFTPISSIVNPSRDNGVSDDQLNSLTYQVGFIWNLMNNNPTYYKLSELKAATSPENAAKIFFDGYERGTWSDTRAAYARAYYNLATDNTPLPPSVPVSNTDSGGSDAGGGSGICGGSIGAYQNPFRDVSGLQDAGIDAGVDFSGEGDVYALGNGTVVYASDSSGWVGGHAIAYKLTDGPAHGKTVYVAENCPVNNSLSVGSQVTSNTVVCHMHNAYPYIETGWATGSTDKPQAYTDNCYYTTNPSIGHKTSTAYGVNFDQLLVKLGNPQGSLLQPPTTCTLPGEWPQW
jgi:hypothetical protein